MEWIVTVEAAVDPAALERRLPALEEALAGLVAGASVDVDQQSLGVTLIVEAADVENALQQGLVAWRSAEAAAGLPRLVLASAEVVAGSASDAAEQTSARRAG